ncbi:MAG: sulfotransferase [Myxococcales bacterium]|nr:sulfotransferase [Myxococcales bacterium]
MYANREAMKALVEGTKGHRSPRRLRTWSGFAAAWMGVRAVVDAGRKLDDRLYPSWREQEVKEPVFIFANGRSGTTMLHRVLSWDEESFASYKLYQSVFSAVAWQRLFSRVGEAPIVGDLGRKAVDAINETFFSGWEGIHELGIDKEEEDEALFVLALESPTVSLLNPFQRDYAKMGWLDAESPEKRRAFMDDYEAALKKHLFSVGGNRRFLNKNVFLAPRLRTMLERFPDARLIYLVRHPAEALPSWLNMFYEKWVTHSPELPHASPQARELAEMSFAYYRYVLEARDSLPPESFFVVRYEELVQDVRPIVRAIYEWLGLPMSEAHAAKLEAFAAKQQSYESKHEYSLEQFGLTKEWVKSQIPEVYAAFGYE